MGLGPRNPWSWAQENNGWSPGKKGRARVSNGGDPAIPWLKPRNQMVSAQEINGWGPRNKCLGCRKTMAGAPASNGWVSGTLWLWPREFNGWCQGNPFLGRKESMTGAQDINRGPPDHRPPAATSPGIRGSAAARPTRSDESRLPARASDRPTPACHPPLSRPTWPPEPHHAPRPIAYRRPPVRRPPTQPDPC